MKSVSDRSSTIGQQDGAAGPGAGGGVDSVDGKCGSVEAAWRSGHGLDPEVLAVRYDPIKKVIFTGGNDHTIKVSKDRVQGDAHLILPCGLQWLPLIKR